MADGDVRSLIDTRKRKSISSSNVSNDWSPRKKKPRDQRHEELRRLVYPSYVPQHEFDALEQMFVDQENEIARRCEQVRDLEKQLRERDDTISEQQDRHEKRKEQVRNLRNKLADTEKVKDRQNDRLYEQEKKIKHMRQTLEQQHQQHYAEIAELDSRYEEQETAIVLSSGLLKQAHAERDQQKQQLFERDARIETLNDRIYKMTTSLPDEAAHVALDHQAQRHLLVMQGLQADLAERDARVENLRAEHAAALEAQEAQASKRISAEIRGLKKRYEEERSTLIANEAAATSKRISSEAKAAKLRTEEVQKHAGGAERRAVAAEKKAEAAGKRAEELKAATVDQKGLIERLMETNKRLAGQQT
ncbi:hypothetical protein LTR85_002230 [Meristemomyces frigidus]|nr:hypothetical protein LTR85_002230 [Meristemomyces frigidus]